LTIERLVIECNYAAVDGPPRPISRLPAAGLRDSRASDGRAMRVGDRRTIDRRTIGDFGFLIFDWLVIARFVIAD
jgi:hypothetical protein